MTYVILPVILITLFLALGLIWLTPEFRANILLWQGRGKEARKIFEYLLKRNPEKANLYPKLAQIYCAEEREDKKAMRVYEIILKLRIPFQSKDQIIPMVAKHYVAEGRKDAEAIRLIEKAVQIELERLRA